MTNILKSKKFQSVVAGFVIIILNSFFHLLDEDAINKLVLLIVAYIGGQGLADFGKEKKQ